MILILCLSILQEISETLGPGKINKVPEQEAITVKAFKVHYVIFFLILNELKSSLDYHSICILIFFL